MVEGAIIIAIAILILGLINNDGVLLFVAFVTFLLPFPVLVRSLRIAWAIIERENSDDVGPIDNRDNRMQLFLSIVLSIFIGIIILSYAFLSLVGLIDNSINTWQQVVGSSFMISLGTTVLLNFMNVSY